MSSRFFAAGVLSLLLLLGGAQYGLAQSGTGSATDGEAQAQIDATNKEIQRLKDEIAALQKELTTTTAQKQTLQNAIKELDLQIQKLQKSVSLTSTQISQKDKEISTIAGDIRTTEQEIADKREGVASSLRQLQEMDQEHMVTALFGGSSLSSFFDEAVSLESLRIGLQQKITELSGLRTDLVDTKKTAEQRRQELAALKANLDQQKKGVTAAKADQTTLLTQTKSKESEYQKLIAQKLAEQANFEKALFDLASGLAGADPSQAPAARSGVLNWPLEGVRVTQQFGRTIDAQRLYSSGTHDGIDLRASVGTPVLAALGGTVYEVNQGAVQNCQYGKWVIVKHPNGLATLYAHLSSINVQKGQSVSTGQTVGLAGSTGYATGPHLHFTVYIAEAISLKQYTCKTGKTVTVPIAPLNAYLNPMSYLPAL